MVSAHGTIEDRLFHAFGIACPFEVRGRICAVLVLSDSGASGGVVQKLPCLFV